MTRRTFRIWRDAAPAPLIGPIWRWECTRCDPPARGARFGYDAWQKIITVSMRHHNHVRSYHHGHVASRDRIWPD